MIGIKLYCWAPHNKEFEPLAMLVWTRNARHSISRYIGQVSILCADSFRLVAANKLFLQNHIMLVNN